MSRPSPHSRSSANVVAIACLVTLLSACAAGPNYRRPVIDAPAAYRTVFTRLYRDCESLADTLMRIFAHGLALPGDWFADKIDHHFSVLGSNVKLPITIVCACSFGAAWVVVLESAPAVNVPKAPITAPITA